LKYFLGIEMTTSTKRIFLNQRKYVINLLKDVDMLYSKPVAYPLDNKLTPDPSNEPLASYNHY
jgi:hypothetical protein